MGVASEMKMKHPPAAITKAPGITVLACSMIILGIAGIALVVVFFRTLFLLGVPLLILLLLVASQGWKLLRRAPDCRANAIVTTWCVLILGFVWTGISYYFVVASAAASDVFHDPQTRIHFDALRNTGLRIFAGLAIGCIYTTWYLNSKRIKRLLGE